MQLLTFVFKILSLASFGIAFTKPSTNLIIPSASRRAFLRTSASLFAPLAILPVVSNAAAAQSGPTKEELTKLKLGYDNVEKLLANWDSATTTCRDNGGECKRDAEPVRRALGLRSTTDPLFQIEKVLAKVKYMDELDDLQDFFDAADEFTGAIAMSNSMAFISQFGEYNPGGGKDEVLKYLEESKKQVIIVRDSLKTVMTTLRL
tara:strand:- start:164 stop:778 length:615 start_codon:yes stop_codon:yes gene_type:complete